MRAGRTTTIGLVLAMSVPATAAADPPRRSCEGLREVSVPARVIGLPTTGGEVRDASPVPASGAIGEHCRVTGAIHPVDPSAPEIIFELALPVEWNHRALMFGGGGYNGTVPAVDGALPFGAPGDAGPLAAGFATFASDSGHQATPGHEPTPSLDGSFGRNDEALRNFAGDALKKTRDAAMYLLRAHYRVTPEQSYFAGGSTGGREGLAVAQRWPGDFDGVISAYPAWNAASLDLFFGHMARELAAPEAFLGQRDQELVYDSVMRACDGLDGATDGVISNAAGCDFDPEVLRCEAGDGQGCLTEAQIRAVRAASSPLEFGYPVASGETGYPGFPLLSGANMNAGVLGFGTAAPAEPMPTDAAYGAQFWDQWVRHFVTRDPDFRSLGLDPTRPGPWRERISELTALQDVNEVDLRPFARRGGKLLLVHGTADQLVSHRATVDYYQRMMSAMGSDAVADFSRLYLVPGADHANANAAFAAGWDSLEALHRWVEDGRAPHDEVVTDVNPEAGQRTRPLCEFPTWPRYDGTGSVDEASSFSCVD